MMNTIYQKFNMYPNQYILKILYKNIYNIKLSNIIKKYGPIEHHIQYDYSFIDNKFIKSLNELKKNKDWFHYYDELNTIEYQYNDMDILHSTGLILINKKNNYVFFNNSFTKWYPSTKILTVDLENVFNEYEKLKIDSFSNLK